MRFNYLPTTGINILHTSPIAQWKLCHNLMISMNFLKAHFQSPLKL